MRSSLRGGSRVAWAGLVLMMIGAGCGGDAEEARWSPTEGLAAPAPAPAPAPESQAPERALRVLAASNLRVGLDALAPQWAYIGGANPEITYDASGTHAAAIRDGAPFDVFLSADEARVRELADAGLIRPDSVAVYARGTLALVVPAASETKVASLADLAGESIRTIAVADPEVAPYGTAARAAIEKAGLADALGPKLVTAGSVAQALDRVKAGEADAGIVALGLVRKDAEVRAVELGPEVAEPTSQALGVAAKTDMPEKARSFANYVVGPGINILGDFGYRGPAAPAPAAAR